MRIANDILMEIDARNVCILALLDLSAAFDTLDHEILLKRLEITFGVKGSALSWFCSYIADRAQKVILKAKRRSDTIMRFGVPIVFVLGPMILTLYTQPLVEILQQHNMNYHFYADDTQLYKGASTKHITD
ncbi:reverse transcriptase [Elysia marginata]|uniref:Reverse transcriptase n=1 Tax=Elysia marginata TaxID=1093978 RepID=A0AAV4HYE8_9GAST|nr:reverse transcriptase [Elysia marginata]